MKSYYLIFFLSFGGLTLQGQETIYKDCQVHFEGVDPVLKSQIKELSKEELFIYTPDALKMMRLDFPLVEGSGNLARTSGYTFFELVLTVNSKRARNDYGYIEKGSMIKFFLLDGSSFYSNNLTNSLPKRSNDPNTTLYVASCSIDKEELKMLSNSYVDKIAVVWSKGYEEYEIYAPDFFVNQLACLEP